MQYEALPKKKKRKTFDINKKNPNIKKTSQIKSFSL